MSQPPPGPPGEGFGLPPGWVRSPAPQVGPSPTTSSSTFPGSTAVLLLVSVVSVVAVGIVGLPSAVIAGLAWRQHGHDPVGAARRTTRGWVTYAVNAGLGALVLVPFYLWALGRG